MIVYQGLKSSFLQSVDFLRGRLRAYADGIFKLSGQLPAAVQTETEAHSSVLM